jgi:hypothetical protein
MLHKMSPTGNKQEQEPQQQPGRIPLASSGGCTCRLAVITQWERGARLLAHQPVRAAARSPARPPKKWEQRCGAAVGAAVGPPVGCCWRMGGRRRRDRTRRSCWTAVGPIDGIAVGKAARDVVGTGVGAFDGAMRWGQGVAVLSVRQWVLLRVWG